jgi:hypothetical protein
MRTPETCHMWQVLRSAHAPIVGPYMYGPRPVKAGHLQAMLTVFETPSGVPVPLSARAA